MRTGKNMELNKVINYLKKQPLMYLATIDGNCPKVRPVALIYHKENFWFVSIAGRDKIKQIKNNNNIEFAVNPNDDDSISTIRGQGLAILIEDSDVKRDVTTAIPWFKEYWDSANDPKFVLYKIELEKVSVQIPKIRDIYTFDLISGETTIKKE